MKEIKLLFVFLFSTITIYAQQTVGLFQNDQQSFNGYTLFAPNSSKTTYLIDNCGLVVKQWGSNFPPGSSAYLLNNGNLLRTARIPGSFNGGGVGGRLELYDWMGNLMWGYDYSTPEHCQHHDVAMLPNGNILLIAWELHTESEALAAGRNPDFLNGNIWSEQIIELRPMGTDEAEIVWEWKLWDHLIQDFDSDKPNFGVVADHPELMDINFTASGGIGGGADWIHFNAINYNPELEQIILSSRHLNEIYIIDHTTTTEEAASHTGGDSGKGGDFLFRWGNPQSYDRGTTADQLLFGQHDAQWIEAGLPDEGKIMVFNNGFGRPGGNTSSVDVITPPLDDNNMYTISDNQPFEPQELFWTYPENPIPSFYSSNVSGAQRLPNGNTLICEGRTGHIFEVTASGEIVWDYVCPVTAGFPVSQGTNATNNSVFRAYRYAEDAPAFDGKILTPGNPIELDPLPSTCELFVGTSKLQPLEGVKVQTNPIREYLVIKNNTGEEIIIEVFDLMGHKIIQHTSSEDLISKNMQHFANGFYIVRIFNVSKNRFFVEKIIKH